MTQSPGGGRTEAPSPLLGAAAAWDALAGDPALLSRLSPVLREDTLPAKLPVRALARSCVGVCALAAAELAALRTGRDVPHARWTTVPWPPRSPVNGTCS